MNGYSKEKLMHFEYYVLIDASAFDDSSSNSYAGISSTTALSFTSINSVPTLTSSVPADDAIDVERDATIVLNFSENVDAESGNITIKKTSDNSIFETIDVTSGQVTGSGSTQITVTPSSNFDVKTEYYILIDSSKRSNGSACDFSYELNRPVRDIKKLELKGLAMLRHLVLLQSL